YTLFFDLSRSVAFSTLSLPEALPIYGPVRHGCCCRADRTHRWRGRRASTARGYLDQARRRHGAVHGPEAFLAIAVEVVGARIAGDRKSTRLYSSHRKI